MKFRCVLYVSLAEIAGMRMPGFCPFVIKYDYQTFNPYSVGIDFSRQNLTSVVNPCTVRVNIFLMAVDP